MTNNTTADTDKNLTVLDFGPSKTQKHDKCGNSVFLGKLLAALPSVSELRQYIGVLLCGVTVATQLFAAIIKSCLAIQSHLTAHFKVSITESIIRVVFTQTVQTLIDHGYATRSKKEFEVLDRFAANPRIVHGFTLWGSCWFVFKEAVAPGASLFNMAGVVIAGYIFGHILERYTTIHPVVGMTLIGALYRNLGPPNFLQDPVADIIDFHLRRIYPVIILTKGPLGWNWDHMKHNYVKVFSLATLPWIVECLSLAFFAHLLLEYPWYWGIHLGAILASVSPAVVVPTVMSLNARGLGVKDQIALLVSNAGGLDTAFTEGMFGIINAAIFYPSTMTYRVVKGVLAIFVGIGLGVIWGLICDYVPDHKDFYAPCVRSLLIFSGGLLLTYSMGYFGWGGVSGVAVMVCAGTAATRWSRRDWPINNNPVSEVYKLLWRIFEPILFTLSGYFLDMRNMSGKEFTSILGCIISALILRLLAAFLVALANDLSVKESLFIAVTWIPKAIVEAVLVRVASDSLWIDATDQDKQIATQHANIIVIAILITSTLGSGLTTALGPILLSQESRVAPEDFYKSQTLSPQRATRRNNTPTSIQNIDI